MKKETAIAGAGIVLLALAFIFQFVQMQQSSPLALFIIVIAGLFISLKYPLIGGALLFFPGMALTIHPFMFSSGYWLLPGAIPVSIAGLMYLIRWWKENGNKKPE